VDPVSFSGIFLVVDSSSSQAFIINSLPLVHNLLILIVDPSVPLVVVSSTSTAVLNERVPELSTLKFPRIQTAMNTLPSFPFHLSAQLRLNGPRELLIRLSAIIQRQYRSLSRAIRAAV